jgi:hypothetical protein
MKYIEALSQEFFVRRIKLYVRWQGDSTGRNGQKVSTLYYGPFHRDAPQPALGVERELSEVTSDVQDPYHIGSIPSPEYRVGHRILCTRTRVKRTGRYL